MRSLYREVQRALAGVGVNLSRYQAKMHLAAFCFGAVFPARETFVLNRLLERWLTGVAKK